MDTVVGQSEACSEWGNKKKKEKKVETEYREVRLRGKQGFN